MVSTIHILQPGDVLDDKYRIEETIARGGAGIVYLASQLGIGRKAVIKTLLPNARLEENALDRFEREARVASRLRHPHIVTVLDFGHSADGLLYIAMERLTGQTIKEVLLAEGALQPARIVHVLRGMLEAVAAAHKHGIVHRDLKPSNVFLCDYHGKPDFVKIIDFGIARVVEQIDDTPKEHTLTQTGTVIGTPGYLSPEALAGYPVGPQADIYAVGIIAYEMLSGRAAFAGSTTLEKLTKQALGDLTPLPVDVHECPLVPLIQRLVAPQLDVRFKTADDAIALLDDLPDLVGWEPTPPGFEEDPWPTSTDSDVITAAPSRDDEVPEVASFDEVSGSVELSDGGVAPWVIAVTAAAVVLVLGLATLLGIRMLLLDEQEQPQLAVIGDSIGATGTSASDKEADEVTRNDPDEQAGADEAEAAPVPTDGTEESDGDRVEDDGDADDRAEETTVADASETEDNETEPVEDRVTITLQSTPAGATVSTPSGEDLGVTPLRVERPRVEASEVFALKKVGYKTARVDISLATDDTRTVRLAPITRRRPPARRPPANVKRTEKKAPRPGKGGVGRMN